VNRAVPLQVSGLNSAASKEMYDRTGVHYATTVTCRYSRPTYVESGTDLRFRN